MTLSFRDPRPSSSLVGAHVGRGVSSSLRRAWHGLTAKVARVEDSLIGDLIGCACLFLTCILLVIFAGVLG